LLPKNTRWHWRQLRQWP